MRIEGTKSTNQVCKLRFISKQYNMCTMYFSLKKSFLNFQMEGDTCILCDVVTNAWNSCMSDWHRSIVAIATKLTAWIVYISGSACFAIWLWHNLHSTFIIIKNELLTLIFVFLVISHSSFVYLEFRYFWKLFFLLFCIVDKCLKYLNFKYEFSIDSKRNLKCKE